MKKHLKISYILLFVLIMYLVSFLICTFIRYRVERQVYVNFTHLEKGIINGEEIVDSNSLILYFNGTYLKTEYDTIDDIVYAKDYLIVDVVNMDETNNRKQLYIVYPECELFYSYNGCLYQKESYDYNAQSYFQNLYLKIWQ